MFVFVCNRLKMDYAFGFLPHFTEHNKGFIILIGGYSHMLRKLHYAMDDHHFIFPSGIAAGAV